VRNLLDNAIQHAPPGSAVRITVDDADQPRVEVIDQGPGFPSDFRDHAFERFSRADPSRNRATGGAGLGLAIARGLVEAHGGTIEAESRPGEGATFRFRLPVEAPRA
jgi:two-component system OmpR family sensor kinase